jgi:hypothetical protein
MCSHILSKKLHVIELLGTFFTDKYVELIRWESYDFELDSITNQTNFIIVYGMKIVKMKSVLWKNYENIFIRVLSGQRQYSTILFEFNRMPHHKRRLIMRLRSLAIQGLTRNCIIWYLFQFMRHDYICDNVLLIKKIFFYFSLVMKEWEKVLFTFYAFFLKKYQGWWIATFC